MTMRSSAIFQFVLSVSAALLMAIVVGGAVYDQFQEVLTALQDLTGGGR